MFITFEGPEGSGKTTQFSLLATFLQERNLPVVATREPGGTSIGNQIRACLHDVNNTAMTSAAEILLYSASRAQLVREVIRPALDAGKIVLCDRYADSTMAYQGYGRQLDLEAIAFITRFATGGLKPDLTFLLDVDVEAGLQRRSAGGEEMNRMDLQTLDFYKRMQEGYYEMAAAEPERWVIVNANRPVAVVQREIRQIASERLPYNIPAPEREGK